MSKSTYESQIATTRPQRMKWWEEAHFGIFIHYGLYSIKARHEWAWAIENCPREEYTDMANSFFPKEGIAEEWVRMAKASGAKYIVLTARHHEGFSLWNSEINDFNSCNYGVKRDIVAEFVEACRKHGMGIGLYFSLMDWYHPDGLNCLYDSKARMRFTNYLGEMLRELMSNYGKIDILWYDMPHPMLTHEGWNSVELNQMVRQLQPDIIINDRSYLKEDFGTQEGKISPDEKNYWESCMTFNDMSWGYVDSEQIKPYSYNAARILRALCRATVFGGNFLLNVGPKADGTIPVTEAGTLSKVGEWLEKYGECILYGKTDRESSWVAFGCFSMTRKKNKVYLWNWIWPSDGTLGVGGFKTKLLSAKILHDTDVEFSQNNGRILLKNLPLKQPDDIIGITPIELTFEQEPKFPDTFRFGSNFPQLNIED